MQHSLANFPGFEVSQECIHAKCTTTERCDLQQAARNRDVLEEVDELPLIRQVVVECECSHHGEERHDHSDDARLKADDEQCCEAKFDAQRCQVAQYRERQAARFNVRNGALW